MNHRYSLLFVLVNERLLHESAHVRTDECNVGTSPRHSGAAFPAMSVSGATACMLVHTIGVDCIDSQIEDWVLATAMRFAELKKRYSQLTPRERQVLPLVAEGMLNKQAASELGISEATLQIHRGRIMEKMAARSFADLVRMADILGISIGADCLERIRESTDSPPEVRSARLTKQDAA